jgi:hypothetical protein
MSAIDDTPGIAVAPRIADRLTTRWPVARPFVVVGFASITAGGVVAAVTRPTGFELGSWLAAFLVLVGGIAQIALGIGQAWMAERPPRSATVTAEVVTWNLGLVATIVGSLASAPVVTAAGAVAIVVALVLFLRGVGSAADAARGPRLLYRGVIAVVLISTPVGLGLAWVRHG